MKDIKVIRVNSWRDLPGAKEEAFENKKDKHKGIETNTYNSGVYGETDYKKRTIHIVKGAPKGALEHEVYHLKHRHVLPSKESDYVKHELEAILYSYMKTGYPKTIKNYLKGIAETILWRRYKGYTKEEAIGTIQTNINKLDVPDRWLRDWDDVRDQIRKAH